MDTSYIYVITNGTNGKRYVGVSKNPTRRLLKGHVYGRGAIGAAIEKYGLPSFTLETIFRASTHECYDLEDRFIELFQARCTQHGYNLTRGGVMPAPIAGVYKRSPETRARMSAAQIGKRHTEETKRKISETKRGIPVNEKRRLQIIENLTGRQVSDETRKKIRDAQIGKSVGDETRRKLSSAATGRKASEETRAKMKESQLKRWAHRKATKHD